MEGIPTAAGQKLSDMGVSINKHAQQCSMSEQALDLSHAFPNLENATKREEYENILLEELEHGTDALTRKCVQNVRYGTFYIYIYIYIYILKMLTIFL